VACMTVRTRVSVDKTMYSHPVVAFLHLSRVPPYRSETV